MRPENDCPTRPVQTAVTRISNERNRTPSENGKAPLAAAGNKQYRVWVPIVLRGRGPLRTLGSPTSGYLTRLREPLWVHNIDFDRSLPRHRPDDGLCRGTVVPISGRQHHPIKPVPSVPTSGMQRLTSHADTQPSRPQQYVLRITARLRLSPLPQ